MSHEPYHLEPGVHEVFATRGPRRHFFGYYDKSPLDAEGRRLLCHAANFDGRLVQADDRVEIGYWDLETETYHPLAKTRAFNWQLGSMLQWLGPDFSHRVIYNDRLSNGRGDHFGAVVLDVDAGTRRELSTTIYSVTPDGQLAVSPRFERHAYCRPGYCYEGVRDERWDGNAPEGDGILQLDLETDHYRSILTVQELMQHQPLPSMVGGAHYVEHMMWDPSGHRFAFLHRWQLADGGIFTRCYFCDRDGGGLTVLPDSGRYSHGCWIDETGFLIAGRPASTFTKVRYSSGPVRRLVRPLLSAFRRLGHRGLARWVHQQATADGFLYFQDPAGPGVEVGRGVLPEDGHPSARPGASQWLLSDSYPDDQGRQHLMAYHLEERRCIPLGWFATLSDHQATGYRCDLHPRWSRCGGRVIIDSLHEGSRQMYVLDVREALDGSTAR